MMAGYLEQEGAPGPVRFPALLTLQFEKVQSLRYGENPHQHGAFYRDFGSSEPGVAKARQLHGKEMSYNNLLDANAALDLVKEFGSAPLRVAVIVKHNNPCGVAVGPTLRDAYVVAREADPTSAFGGVIAFNARVDLATAKEVTATFVEVVVGPGFDEDALAELRRKKDLRLLAVGELRTDVRTGPDLLDLKKIVGGRILQDRELGAILEVRTLKVASQRGPTDAGYAPFPFAWTVC